MHGTAATQTTSPSAGSERRCIVSGAPFPKEALMRFCVNPQGVIVPDVAGCLPGRGIWVQARALSDRTSLHTKAFCPCRETGGNPTG